MESHFKTAIRIAIIISCVFSTALFQNCDSYYSVGQRSGESVAGFTLDNKAQTILSQNCYTCHADSQNSGGFSHVQDITMMIQEGFIIPGDADNSPLIEVLSANTARHHYLSDNSVDILRDWVDGLAERFTPPSPTALPTCTITVDKTAINLGETVNATLTTQDAQSAILNGMSVNARGTTRPISLIVNGRIQAQVRNTMGTSLCQSPVITVTTPEPLPGSQVPSCTLTANRYNVVPGDNVTLTLRITRIATSATLHGTAVSNPETGEATLTFKPATSATYNATVTGGGGTASCKTEPVSIKLKSALSKEEFFRAKIFASGSTNLSVNDLLTRGRRSSTSANGGGCIACHASNGDNSFVRARLYFTLTAGDASGNFAKLKNIPSTLTPAVPNITVPHAKRDLHKIVSTNVHYRATSRTIGGGGDDDNDYILWSQVEHHLFTTPEINFIKEFVDKP